MYVQGNSIHWNLIGRSTTDLPPVLSPSSIPPAALSYCAPIPELKNSSPFKNVIFQVFIIFYDYVSRVVCAPSMIDDAVLSNKDYKSESHYDGSFCSMLSALNLHFPINTRDQGSHPYTTTHKTAV